MRYKTALRSFITNDAVVAAFKLISVWLIGLILGGYVASETAHDFSLYFFAVCSKEITFLGVMLALLIPLLVSVCLGNLFSADTVLLVVFLKAIAFAFVAVACAYSWGSAGWLVSRMLMFSDLLCIPVLLWVWHGILCRKLGKMDVIVSFLLVSIIGLVDFLVISPVLCSIF